MHDAFKIQKVVSLCVLAVFIFGCAGSKDVTKMSREEKKELVNDVWTDACMALRANMRNDMSKYIQYSKRPTMKVLPSSWVMRWQGVNVPIPAAKYDDVVLLPGPSMDDVDIMFIQNNGLVVSLRRVTDFIPMDDVASSLAALIGRTVTGEVAQEFSSVLFDRPVAVADMIDIGYSNTPDNITCDKKKLKDEVPIIVGLAVKAPNGSDLQAVYHDMGEYRGWVEKSLDKESIVWHSHISTHSPNDVLMVSYHLGSKKDTMQMGLGLGFIQSSTTENYPPWWKALDDLVKEVTLHRLQELRKAFEDAGLGQKSIDGVTQLEKQLSH